MNDNMTNLENGRLIEHGSGLEEKIVRDLAYRIEYFHCCYVPVREIRDSLMWFQPTIVKDPKGIPALSVYPTEKDVNAAGVPVYQKVYWGSVFMHVLAMDAAEEIIIFGENGAYTIGKLMLWTIFEEVEMPDFCHIDHILKKALVYTVQHFKGGGKEREPLMDYSAPIASVLGINGVRIDNIALVTAGILSELLREPDYKGEEVRRFFGHRVADMLDEVRELGPVLNSPDYRRLLKKWNKDAKKESRILLLCMMYAYQRKLLTLKTMEDDEGNKRLDGTEIELLAKQLSFMQDELYDMQFDEYAGIYWDVVAQYKDLFVRYYYDEAGGRLYTEDVSGEGSFMMDRELYNWVKWNDGIPASAKPVLRGFAERTEDNWKDLFDEANSAGSVRMEDYISSLRRHIAIRAADLPADYIDELIDKNMGFICEQFLEHKGLVNEGKVDESSFRSESSGFVSDWIIRMNQYTVEYFVHMAEGYPPVPDCIIKVINGTKPYRYVEGEWVPADKGMWRLSGELDDAQKITKETAQEYIEQYF